MIIQWANSVANPVKSYIDFGGLIINRPAIIIIVPLVATEVFKTPGRTAVFKTPGRTSVFKTPGK